MWNILEDLKYGKIREKLVVAFLNENLYPNEKLKLYQNEKKQVDFRNGEVIGELKSRTNAYERYPTTFFGYNKVKYLKTLNDNRVWKFYFLFTDGLYVWTYNEEQYEIRDYEHKERGMVEQVYVPIKYLELLTCKINSNSRLPENYEDWI